MAKKKESISDSKEVKIPIIWNTPDNMLSRYASNVLVHILENEFKLSFYEIQPKIRLNPSDPLPKEVRADCVANIIISPNKIPALIKALNDQLGLFVQLQSEKHKQEKEKKA